ncbi:MAG TPA: aldehyde dehydrogenase family protein, partial [Candidatus Kapabacteria bacterium]|nr:aldehyde dehydrogenase family protein [Candidatus Kapabacteria bacterium]
MSDTLLSQDILIELKPQKANPKPGKHFINGQFVDSVSGKTFDTINPATGEVIVPIAEGDAADVDLAVKAARAAFEEGSEWRKMSAQDRQRRLQMLADLIRLNMDELSELETLDTGKPIFESSKFDIPQAAECFEYYAGWVTKITGETIPVSKGGDVFAYTLREPIGVCGQIIPWNFPLQMLAWKVAPALACGNTVVLKPAEQTPLTALRFAELTLEAGIPAGVFNVVTGFGHVAGAALVDHPQVDKIAFTGSVEVGKQIMMNAAKTLKRVSLELGGKSPNIVFADSDIELAAKYALGGIFFNQGEMCTAGSRIFIEASGYDQFMSVLTSRANKMVAGDPLHPKTRLGALISSEHLKNVMNYVEIGKAEGANVVAGGSRIGTKGFFMKPTVLDNVTNSMRVAQEEIFGPVASVIKFNDVEEAIREANNSAFGLAASIWTKDIKKAHNLARSVKAGTVWINTISTTDNALPFGGYKASGFGRELGKAAID